MFQNFTDGNEPEKKHMREGVKIILLMVIGLILLIASLFLIWNNYDRATHGIQEAYLPTALAFICYFTGVAIAIVGIRRFENLPYL